MDRPFHQLQSPKVEVFLTGDRGWGVKAAEPVAKGSFIVEYAGKCLRLVMPSIPLSIGSQSSWLYNMSWLTVQRKPAWAMMHEKKARDSITLQLAMADVHVYSATCIW